MWQFRDYLAISEDFIPVFSEEVDKNHQGNWKFFIPHQRLREMIEKLTIALERGHSGDKRSLWLTGSYGTGKTFASFVIKHLLEDRPEEIEDYFEKHQIITPIWPRFKTLRKNNQYLVVYRSASGHVTSNRRLMVEIQQAIRAQLKAKGYTNTFGESIMDQLISKLTDSSGIYNWEGVFNKYRGHFRTVSSAEEVIERLRAGDVKVGEQVANVLEEEGLSLVDSPTAVKNWIREVISANNLQGIVFIWDEFTEFFGNNVPVTPLQELAQATVDMPFYLFLVTHKALNQFTRIDDDTRKKLLDRFHTCQLEMSPVTAYRLIANVIETNLDVREAWEAKRDSLWVAVDRALLHINVLGERVNKDEFKMLAPIHPFTAYLLATISSLYSSSQRTLFQFLKKDELGSFQWFITNYPKDNWYWLTPDFLWQYFFEDAKIETIDTINDILSHFHTVKGSLVDEDDLRVFRVMLLLTALRRQTQGVNDLLKPSLSVLKRMFVGTELAGKVGDIAESLGAKGIMLAVPSAGNDFEYIIPTATIDHSKLQQYKQRAETSLSFEKMIAIDKMDAEFAQSLKELLFLQGAAKLRHPLQFVSTKDFKHRRERVLQGVEKPYEIGVILILAQDDEHLHGIEEIAKEISQAHSNYILLVSQSTFGSKRWGEWLDCRARSWYHEEMRDANTKKYYDSKSKILVSEWVASVRTTRIRGFYKGNQMELTSSEAITGYLEDTTRLVYPDGPEKLSKIATLYTSSWGKAGAEVGLKIAQRIQSPYKDVVDELRTQGIWDDGSSISHKNHLLSKMKDRIDSNFATQDNISIKYLWETLQQPPFGLMPSPIGILLFSFLLRSYSNGYYYSDGINSFPLNPNKFVELIEQVMKGARQSDLFTIRKMSAQGELFCHMARDIFHLTHEQTAYPEEARKNIRRTVIELGYPLWTLAYYVQKTSRLPSTVQAVQRFTTAMDNILAYGRDELDDTEIKNVIDVIQPIRRELHKLISRDKLQEGILVFFNSHNGHLIQLMNTLNMDIPQIMNRLKMLSSEEIYLWKEERVSEKLADVVSELDLVNTLNTLFGTTKSTVADLRNHFRIWFRSKYPLLCYKEEQNAEVQDAIQYLFDLMSQTGQSVITPRLSLLQNSMDVLKLLPDSSINLTKLLVKKFTRNDMSDEEASSLYENLPDLSGSHEGEVRSKIFDILVRQAKQKKIIGIRQQWRQLTKSDSPERWSEAHKTPIQWVFDGADYQSFIASFANLQHLLESQLDEINEYLNNNIEKLSVLENRDHILERFVQVASGDYVDLVRQAGAGEALRDYVSKKMAGSVFQWPVRTNEVSRLVKDWIIENYQATAYPQLVRMIETVSPDDIRSFVKNLISEDALVGARLLAAIEKKKQN